MPGSAVPYLQRRPCCAVPAGPLVAVDEDLAPLAQGLLHPGPGHWEVLADGHGGAVVDLEVKWL